MKIVTRYLSAHIAGGIFVSLLALTALLSVIDFIDAVDNIGEDGYTIGDALLQSLLGLALHSYDFFPVAVLIGGAIALVSLSDKRELLALLAIGYSRRAINILLLGFSAVLMLLMFGMGELVIPQASMRLAEIEHSRDDSSSTVQKTANGYWMRRGANYIHLRSMQGLAQGTGVTVYHINSQQEIANVFYADHAQLTSGHLVLSNGREIQLQKGGIETIQNFSQRHIAIPHSGDLSLEHLIPQAMNVFQLWSHIRFLHQNMINSNRYELAFWSRFSTILTIPIMLFLALLWAFAPPRSDSVRRRVFAAILLGIVYVLLSRFIGTASIVWGGIPALGAFAPIGVFLLIYIVLFKRLSQ